MYRIRSVHYNNFGNPVSTKRECPMTPSCFEIRTRLSQYEPTNYRTQKSEKNQKRKGGNFCTVTLLTY